MEGVLKFKPGVNNILLVRPSWESLSTSQLKCKLIKTLPDGTTERIFKRVANGDNFEILALK